MTASKRDGLFAATTPWEPFKALVTLCVTIGIGTRRGVPQALAFYDVRRAYFHAKARRVVYVDLPDEDWEPGMCGRLNKSMYGTRDAAQNWEEEYCDFPE